MTKKYRLRILRNLLLTAILLIPLWRQNGYPLPTMEMELHRWERQTLREVSEIIWSMDQTSAYGAKQLAGVNRDSVHIQSPSCHWPVCWPRHGDRATLVALVNLVRYWPEGGINLVSPALLAIDPPRWAERARLTLTLFLEDSEWQETYEMEGERQGEVFFFLLRQKYYTFFSSWAGRRTPLIEHEWEKDAIDAFADTWQGEEELNRWPWHLEFFDSEGNLLEEQFSKAFPVNGD